MSNSVVSIFDTKSLEGVEKFFLDSMVNFSKQLKGVLPYNVYKEEDKIIFEVAVAGYKAEDLDISVADGTIKIKGKSVTDSEIEYVYKGVSSKSFSYMLPLQAHYEVQSATVKDGMLKIVIARTKGEEPKQVPINKK